MSKTRILGALAGVALVFALVMGFVAPPTASANGGGGDSEAVTECAPEFVTEERQVEVGTEYEYQLQQWAFFKWVDNGNPFFSATEPDEPGLFKRYVQTGNERPIFETQLVEVANPEFDPECGQQPQTFTTVVHLLPVTAEEYVALGSPTGPGDNGIWPQTVIGHATTESIDLDAADAFIPETCNTVYQVDVYPTTEAQAAMSDGILESGEDSSFVLAWKIVVNDPCEPEVTPTPEPTETPTVTPEPDPEPEPSTTPAVEPEPTPVYDVTICYDGQEHLVTAAQAVGAFEVGASAGTCAEPPVRSSSTVDIPGNSVPQPAKAGMGVMLGSDGQGALGMVVGVAMTLGTLFGARALAYRKRSW